MLLSMRMNMTEMGRGDTVSASCIVAEDMGRLIGPCRGLGFIRDVAHLALPVVLWNMHIVVRLNSMFDF